MQEAVAHAPALAHAVRRLSLYDQLALTLRLLRDEWPEPPPSPEVLPANVVRFRPRR